MFGHLALTGFALVPFVLADQGAPGTVVQRAYLKASNAGQGDSFGGSVSVSGDTLVVGAPFESSAATGVGGDQSDDSAFLAGAVYVFQRTGMFWAPQAYLKASNTGQGDLFGFSVAISGDTIVVGAPFESSAVDGDGSDDSTPAAGAAYVFARSGTSWTQQALLKASNAGSYDMFGESVSNCGDTVIVGASAEDSSAVGVDGDQGDGTLDSGAAYVFAREGTSWSQSAYLKPSNTDVNDRFGSSVTVSGDTVVVGAELEDSAATGVDGDARDEGAEDSGAAYVFVRTGTGWMQEAYLKPSNTGFFDTFGASAAISADTLVIGADHEDGGATGVNGDEADDSSPGAGAAYVFVRTGTDWEQEAYLKASNTGASDLFGQAVAISGERILVGAVLEASSAQGIDGDQSDDAAEMSGAAYLFVRGAAGWSQTTYLKASNSEAGDQFGGEVALSGTFAAVGAPGEDSAGTRAKGPADNSADLAGACYLFDLDAPLGDSYCGPAVPNSTGSAGVLGAAGSLDAADENLRLLASDLPPGNVCLFLASRNQGFLPLPGSSCGNLCLMGPDIARFKFDAQLVDEAGDCSLQIDPFIVLTNPPQPILDGQTWHFQAWHRDAGAGPECDNNFTDALAVTFGQ